MKFSLTIILRPMVSEGLAPECKSSLKAKGTNAPIKKTFDRVNAVFKSATSFFTNTNELKCYI
jgi:hypothetical protein